MSESYLNLIGLTESNKQINLKMAQKIYKRNLHLNAPFAYWQKFFEFRCRRKMVFSHISDRFPYDQLMPENAAFGHSLKSLQGSV